MNEPLTSQEILTRIESSSNIFRDVLHSNQGLYGLLLGFGKSNAFAYQDLFVKRLPLKLLASFNGNFYDPLVQLSSLNFAVVEDDPETLELKKKYQEQKEKIVQIYAQGDLLEITLEAFMR